MAAYLLSRLRAVAAAVVVVLAAGAPVEAQDLEPRAYANTPVGLNFLLLGYGYQTGEVAFDPSTPIEDAELTAHGAFLAYARALNVWGRAGKLDVVLPYGWVSGTATVAGEPRDRRVSGLGDPRLGIPGIPVALVVRPFEQHIGALDAPRHEVFPDEVGQLGEQRGRAGGRLRLVASGRTQRVEPRSVRVSHVSCMDLGYSQLPGVPSAGFV